MVASFSFSPLTLFFPYLGEKNTQHPENNHRKECLGKTLVFSRRMYQEEEARRKKPISASTLASHTGIE
jgi:hypothetical protein